MKFALFLHTPAVAIAGADACRPVRRIYRGAAGGVGGIASEIAS